MIGALGDKREGKDSGTVFVYEQQQQQTSMNNGFAGEVDGCDWILLEGDAMHGSPGSRFGTAIVLSQDGNKLYVGAPFSAANGVNTGDVLCFQFNTYYKLTF